MTKVVLFVCYGNAYRSQWAEAFFNHHNGNPDYVAESAGAICYGVPEDSIARMAETGIDISRKNSRKITPKALDKAWRIYDLAHLVSLDSSSFQREKVVQLPVDDPNSKPDSVQRQIRDTIEERVKKILQELGQPIKG